MTRQQRSVLVVDDEAPVRETVTDILDYYGISVLVARDGQEGLELFGQHQRDVGLIILDMSMPGLSGEETYQQLRKLDRRVPVIVSSAYDYQDAMKLFLPADNVYFMQKPYRLKTLVEQVKTYLK